MINYPSLSEDELLDIPDEMLIRMADSVLRKLNINVNEKPSYSPEEIDARYDEFLKLATELNI